MQVLIQSECAMVQNNLVMTLPYFGKEFHVKFDVFPTYFETNRGDVIRFNAYGENNAYYGNRYPSVFFRNFPPNKLRICSAVNGNINHCYDYENGEDLKNRWSTIDIAQTRFDEVYNYTIKLNGNLVHAKINDDARRFYDVKLYLGNPWHKPQPGFIRNLSINGNDIFLNYPLFSYNM